MTCETAYPWNVIGVEGKKAQLWQVGAENIWTSRKIGLGQPAVILALSHKS